MNPLPSLPPSPLNGELRATILRFVRGKVADPHLAEELTHEALLKAARKLDGVRDSQKMTAWLFTIARNTINDHFRAHRPAESFDETHHATDTEAPVDFDEEAARAQLNAYVRSVVLSLPAPSREAIEQVDYLGLTQTEYARHAGLSVSGAKSRVQRARAEVRRIIEDCCHFETDRYGDTVECTPHPKPARCGDCSLTQAPTV